MSVGVELLAFFVLTVVALLLLNRWLIGRATHALDQAAEELVRRSPGDLKPIETENPPRELVPLLRAINCLFARVGQAMATERTFSTNAAHELRTPLAAVRIQAQVAERARSSSGTHEALEQLGVCVDRASRMVDQLLMLARVGSSPIAASTMSLVDMDRLVGQVVAELGPMFAQHKIGIETRLEPAKVFGLEFALASMVRNLLENAARYTPDGGVVRVETLQEGRSTCIVVEDSGPGISVEERERVFEPFYRIPTEGVEGCGIGLSIVRSVVGVHHGQIRLAEAVLGGLRVTVRLPSDGVVNSRLSS
jgi:signal transduction histidine kinase